VSERIEAGDFSAAKETTDCMPLKARKGRFPVDIAIRAAGKFDTPELGTS
jgi:hypothetical protein